MEPAAIAASLLAMQQAQYANELGVRLMKMAIQSETSSVLTLLEGASQSSLASNPPHLGNLVDTSA